MWYAVYGTILYQELFRPVPACLVDRKYGVRKSNHSEIEGTDSDTFENILGPENSIVPSVGALYSTAPHLPDSQQTSMIQYQAQQLVGHEMAPSVAVLS